jgi:thiol-disulfide isomerase/thioredoxin
MKYLLFFFPTIFCFGQTNTKFVLEIQNDTYEEILISTCSIDPDYFKVSFDEKIKEAPFQIANLTRNSKNNNFKLSGESTYPFPIQIIREVHVNEKQTLMYLSEIYFITEPNDKIILDKLDSANHSIKRTSKNSLKKQDKKVFEIIKNHFAKENPKFNGFYYGPDKDFDYDFYKKIIKQYPKSYIPLWFLIIELERNGFSTDIKDLLHYFDEDIISSELLIFFKQKIERHNIEKFIDYLKFDSTQKYTLYEYWATWCGPCILNLIELSKLKSNPNLEIYLISLNSKEDSIKVKNVLFKHKILFENHYLENSKIEFEPTSIPFSILVNNLNRKIEAINPKTETLKLYLKE